MREQRAFDEMRPLSIQRHVTKHAQGSVLITMGDTKVLCTAMVEEKVPGFLKGEGKGWVTAEYAMLPSSCQYRKSRERNKVDGRSQEIQRLIGRSLRSVVDLEALGERTLWIDCDVLQADGGTRTAAITGAFVALCDAVYALKEEGVLSQIPIQNAISAVSVGIVENRPLLDLCYEEDAHAHVDMNIIMSADGKIVEIQGTGEKAPFQKEELFKLLSLGEKGNQALFQAQKEALADIASHFDFLK